MIKHLSLIHRREGQSMEEFRSYWEDTHSKLVKTLLPGLRKYVGNFATALPNAGRLVSGHTVSADAIIELHFDGLEAMVAAFDGEGWQSSERKESSARQMDMSKTTYLVAEEVQADL